MKKIFLVLLVCSLICGGPLATAELTLSPAQGASEETAGNGAMEEGNVATPAQDAVEPVESEDLEQKAVQPAPVKKVRPVVAAVPPAGPVSDKLIDIDSARTSSRLTDLERRLSKHEQDTRFMEEQIRNLQRDVDNLRRSR